MRGINKLCKGTWIPGVSGMGLTKLKCPGYATVLVAVIIPRCYTPISSVPVFLASYH